jgi:hypothetical protein
MPVLLLRARREILPGLGRIVSDIDANHYTVNTSEGSVAAIRAFFGLD